MRMTGKQIAILLAEGVEDLELYVPSMRLQEEGAEVIAAGLTLQRVRGKHGLEIIPLLHPSILEDLGLSKAIEAECRQFATREGIAMSASVQTVPREIPKDIALTIYRIVQESLNNIAKHACARCVDVSLNKSEIGLHLTVKDDGIGFDAAEVRSKAGLGLSSIRERVRLVQGMYRICSEPGRGTTIEVTVPLKSKLLTETPTPVS
jgi:signal transduction histidine kinase